MFHAVIRNRQGALHFIGEVDGYCLDTLRDHIGSVRRQADPSCLHLQIGVDAEQREEFEQRTRRWVKNLLLAGATVTITSGLLP